jgi:hypothetical protein
LADGWKKPRAIEQVSGGLKKIQILFHEIDSWVHVRAAGRLFAQKMGYTWKWRVGKLPYAVGIAEKNLPAT